MTDENSVDKAAASGQGEQEETTLEKLKADLKALQEGALKASFEAKGQSDNLAALTKLVDLGKAALEKYAAAHPELSARQTRLEEFAANTKPDLEKILQPDGLAAVEDIITSAIGVIDDTETEVTRLKGKLPAGGQSTVNDPWIRGAVRDAAAELAEAEKAFAEAEKTLKDLETLTKSVGVRQEAMQGAKKEILSLGRSGQPATAYWLLTESGRTDAAGHEILDGSGFFAGMTDPAVIDPGAYEAALVAAWEAFEAKRLTLSEKRAALKANEDALAAAEKTLTEVKKNFGKTIRDALAEWETDRVNPAA